MPKYWVKNYFTHGRFPEVGQKQKTERERKRDWTMVITMAKLRMAHASTHGARNPPGPKKHWVNCLSNIILSHILQNVFLIFKFGKFSQLQPYFKLNTKISLNIQGRNHCEMDPSVCSSLAHITLANLNLRLNLIIQKIPSWLVSLKPSTVQAGNSYDLK